jgi:hypothetical protein
VGSYKPNRAGDPRVLPGDDVVDVDRGTAGHPDPTQGRIIDGEVIDPTSDGAREGRIGSRTLRAFCLRRRDVRKRAPRSSHLQEVAEDDGVAGGSLDLQHHLCGEEDARVAGHQARQKKPWIPLPGMPTVRFVLWQVHPRYAQVVYL